MYLFDIHKFAKQNCAANSSRFIFRSVRSGGIHGMDSDKIKYLLEWCSSVGIRIDPRLEIMENYDAGICVFSRDEYISNSTTREFSFLRSHRILT